MVPRQWLAVAVVALAACVAGRPGAPDGLATSTISNEINTKEVNTKPEALQSDKLETTLSGEKKTEGAAVIEAKAEDIKSSSTEAASTSTAVVTTSTEAASTSAAVVTTSTEAASASTEAVPTSTESVSSATEPAATPAGAKPVHELYPHAVLFGGTCGGSIISSTWVLTAGHCTLFSGGRYVLAGTNNSEDGTGVVRHVKRLVIHPRFSVGPYWLDADRFHIKQVAANWDFLLAELEEPLPLNGKTIKAAELDEGPSIPEGLEVGYAGYGTLHHGDVMREDMHGMDLQIMANSKCEEKLEQFEAEDMICTKGRPPRYDSACNGDSGSGLVGSGGKLYGVASWVQDDAHRCFNGALVVFSRVAAVRDWIRQVTSI